MKIHDLREAIKSGKIVKIVEGVASQNLATFGTFLKYVQNEDLKEVLASHFKATSKQIVTLGEFTERIDNILQLPGNRTLITSLKIVAPNSTAKRENAPEAFFVLELHVPEEERPVIEVDDELWQETLELVQKELPDLLDQDPLDISLPVWLWQLGIIDENNPPLEGARKKLFSEATQLWKESKPSESFVKINVIARAIQFSKLRYRVQHDAIKVAVSGRNKPEDLPVKLLKNGDVEYTEYCLGEKEKKPLTLYHYMALFDLLLRMFRTMEIKNQFAVAKSNQKIPAKYRKMVITNETIKEKLEVNDYEATRIKKAIYELSQLVIIFNTRDGARVGILPIRRRGFFEKSDEKIDFFEIDTIFLYNGEHFIPMIPNSFKRLHELPASGRTKEFATNVFLYLLEKRNFKTNKCFISARSFSKKFPNAYAKSRRWSELHRKIGEVLQMFYEHRLIKAFRECGDHYEVGMRN